ncbi:MAG: RelA/SpoT family protein, partial [Gallionellaceae bacterium]
QRPGSAAWLGALSGIFPPSELETIVRACELAEPLYAGSLELTGVPVMQHALGAASILIGMNMDAETIAACVLHALPDFMKDWSENLQELFGANVKNLVEGFSRMEQIQQFGELDSPPGRGKNKGNHVQQIEGLRKMLLAMVEDIRVVLIKLAERTQTLRKLSGASSIDQQKLIAREILSIFAPLANRLGVWQIKWEMEDLSLRYLEPELYKKVAGLLDERRVDREQYIADIVSRIRQALQQAGLKAEVTGRPKHIYSIVNKMKRKQVDFSDLYDVRAVRILVDDISACYAALSVVHELWPPIQSEFDDYIAHPKSNNYQSLHTAVVGPRGLALEVQIRTFEMHRYAELGIAAHWRYKEGGKADNALDQKVAWLRQVLDWKDEVAREGDMPEQFRNELFADRVYVFTPQGKVVDLPKDATPIDFAYALHTDLGHRTRGAKVDGSIVPLNFRLHTGQRVEILTAKHGSPSRDWINPALGYLQSPRARAKVRNWFRQQNQDENIARGRALLDRELRRLGITSANQEGIAQKLHFNKPEDFLAALGRGEITAQRIFPAVRDLIPARTPEKARNPTPVFDAERSASPGILVEGVGNLMTKVAKCCKPVPPDEIVGYVTRDRGITIHRRNCPSMLRMAETRQDRLLAAQWGSGKGAETFSVDVEIVAHDRQGLLRDVGDLFARERVNVSRVESLSRDNQARMRFTLEITDRDQLKPLLALIRDVPGVISVRREV